MKRVYPGMTAHLSDGGTGTVVDVLVEQATGEERYVVLSVDGYFGPQRVAPLAAVWHVDQGAYLALTSPEAAALPRYDGAAHGPAAGLHRRPHTTTTRHA